MEFTRVDENYENKMTAFEIDCNDGKGEAIACHHMAEFFSVVKDEHDRAAKAYAENCNKKNYGPSCFNLARLYIAGRGVPLDDNKAQELFGKACDEKHLQGCYHSAIMQYFGKELTMDSNKSVDVAKVSTKTVPETREKAMKLFDWACKEGEYESCYFIGSHYLKKEQPDRNPALAIEYLKKSCASNHAPSCYNLAVMYRNGDTNVPMDKQKFEEYKEITSTLVKQFGGLAGKRAA